MVKEKIILGIDPGTTIMGYGIISVVGNKMTLITLGETQLSKYETHYLKLKVIFFGTQLQLKYSCVFSA